MKFFKNLSAVSLMFVGVAAATFGLANAGRAEHLEFSLQSKLAIPSWRWEDDSLHLFIAATYENEKGQIIQRYRECGVIKNDGSTYSIDGYYYAPGALLKEPLEFQVKHSQNAASVYGKCMTELDAYKAAQARGEAVILSGGDGEKADMVVRFYKQ